MNNCLRYVISGILAVLLIATLYSCYYVGSTIYTSINSPKPTEEQVETFTTPESEVKVKDLKTFYDGFVNSIYYKENNIESTYIEGDDLFTAVYEDNTYRIGYSKFYQCITIYDAKKSSNEDNPQPINIIYLYEVSSIDKVYEMIAFYLYSDVVTKEEALEFSYDEEGNISLKIKE